MLSSITDLQQSLWGKRAIHIREDFCLPNRKSASSFIKVSFNYENWQAWKGTWQLNFGKTFALAAKEDLLFCWSHEKKKWNILQLHLNFLSPLPHKNKRWFFKVSVSALLDILIWVWPNNWPNPSGWKSKICCDFHPSAPVLSPSQWQIVSFPSFFTFLPPRAKHSCYKNYKKQWKSSLD